MDMKEIGSIIRARRKELGITIAFFSEEENIGNRVISEIERGKETARIDYVMKICRMLDLEIVVQRRKK